MNTFFYISSIVLVNIGFANIQLVQLPWGDMWPPTSLAVGFVFVLRDYAQREIGHKVILAMLLGAAISYVMASPIIAIASVTAYIASELLDWLVYSLSKTDFMGRILLSSAISTPVDSIVFLWMIGHLSISAVVVMTVSKMVAAVIVWKMLKSKNLLAKEAEGIK